MRDWRIVVANSASCHVRPIHRKPPRCASHRSGDQSAPHHPQLFPVLRKPLGQQTHAGLVRGILRGGQPHPDGLDHGLVVTDQLPEHVVALRNRLVLLHRGEHLEFRGRARRVLPQRADAFRNLVDRAPQRLILLLEHLVQASESQTALGLPAASGFAAVIVSLRSRVVSRHVGHRAARRPALWLICRIWAALIE